MVISQETGKLVRWNKEKGFGFIKPENGSPEIFIHISALKSMSREPVVGDTIAYQTSFDDSGRIRAVNGKIEGVSSVLTLEPISRKPNRSQQNLYIQSNHINRETFDSRSKNPLKTISILGVSILLISFFLTEINNKLHSKPKQNVVTVANETIAERSEPIEHFECKGKVYCSQMRSYSEALFYLENCPGTKMDGDNDGIPNDGIPCEQQF